MTSVLILDGDGDARVAAANELRAFGYEPVLDVGSLAEVTAVINQLRNPCVVYVDMALAQKNACIASVTAALPDVALIAVSAEPLAEVPAGFHAVATKPFVAKTMIEQVAGEAMRQVTRTQTLPSIVTVLALRKDDPSPKGVVAGGTGCLVALAERRVLLTAKHVADALRAEGVTGIMGGHASPPVDIARWPLVDSSAEIDMATIEVPSQFDPASINKRFYEPKRWPPPRATPGEVAFFTGFAGIHRFAFQNRLDNYAATFTDFVTTSSQRHFTLVDEQLERAIVEFYKGLPLFGPTGGVSGAPVFLNRDVLAELAGVIYEGGEGQDAMFFVGHVDFILADGLIDHGRMP